MQVFWPSKVRLCLCHIFSACLQLYHIACEAQASIRQSCPNIACMPHSFMLLAPLQRSWRRHKWPLKRHVRYQSCAATVQNAKIALRKMLGEAFSDMTHASALICSQWWDFMPSKVDCDAAFE